MTKKLIFFTALFAFSHLNANAVSDEVGEAQFGRKTEITSGALDFTPKSAPNYCHPGRPINPVDGEVYIVNQPDFKVQNSGSEIVFYRTYRSLTKESFNLGPGWISNFDEKIELKNNYIIHTGATGEQSLYSYNSATKSYLSESSPSSKFQKLGNSFLFTSAEQVSKNFSTSGKLTYIQFKSGQKVNFSYENDSLKMVEDSWGRKLFFFYQDGKLTHISDGPKDPKNAIVRFSYDSKKRLAKVVNRSEESESYKYHDNSSGPFFFLLSQFIDGAGRIVESHDYDSNGKALSSFSQEGLYKIKRFQKNNEIHLQVTDEKTRQVAQYSYNTQGQQTSRSPNSHLNIPASDLNKYDSQGNLIYQKNQGQSYQLEMKNGKLSQFHQDGNSPQKTSIEYNKTNSLPAKITQPSIFRDKLVNIDLEYEGSFLSKATRSGWTLSAQGTLVPFKDVYKYKKNSLGQMTSVVLPNGQIVHFSYYSNPKQKNNFGRLEKVKEAEKEIFFLDYDLWGNPSAIQYGKKLKQTLTKDAMGKPLIDNHGSLLGYDQAGQISEFLNNGELGRFSYDLYQSQSKVTTSRLGQVDLESEKHLEKELEKAFRVTKDESGQIKTLSSKTGKNLQARFEYDSWGRLAEVKFPDGMTFSFQHDDRGHLVQTDNSVEGKTYFIRSYDGLLLKKVSAGDNTTFDYSYNQSRNPVRKDKTQIQYKNDFLPVKWQNMDSEINLDYGHFGDQRYVQKMTFLDSAKRKVEFKIHLTENLEQVSYPSKDFIQNKNINRRQSININNHLKVEFSQSPNPNTGDRVPSSVGKVKISHREEKGLLNKVKIGSDLTDYQYFKNGLLKTVSNSFGHSEFSYDEKNHLTLISTPVDKTHAKYDISGNLTDYKSSEETFSLKYQNYRPTQIEYSGRKGVDKISYDSRGRTTSIGSAQMKYNKYGQMISFEKPGTKAVYTYDPLGHRNSKTVNGVKTDFFYDPQGRLLREENANQSVSYFYKDRLLVAFKVTEKGNTQYFYVINDHLNSPKSIVDSKGKVVATGFDRFYRRDYFKADKTLFSHLKISYPGQYYDEESGLVYNIKRYLSPKIARYLTPDPSGLDGGFNLYAYANSNPVNFIDPNGLKPSATQAPSDDNNLYCEKMGKRGSSARESSRSLWQVGDNRWNEDWEAEYSRWISSVEPDFLNNAGIKTDCADATIALRMIFSRLNHLPFLVHGNQQIGHFSTNWGPSNDWALDTSIDSKTLAQKIAKDSNFKRALDQARASIRTSNLKDSTFPIELYSADGHISKHFRPGLVFNLNGHARTYWKNSEAGPQEIYSTVTIAQKDLGTGPVDVDLFTDKIGEGIVGWNWTVYCNGRWQHVNDEVMPGYSMQQYEKIEELRKEVENGAGLEASRRLLLQAKKEVTTPDGKSMYDRKADRKVQIDRVRQDIEARNASAQLAWLEWQKLSGQGDSPEKHKEDDNDPFWHEYSTPSRDKRVLRRYVGYAQEFTEPGEREQIDAALKKDKIQFSDSKGELRTITYYDFLKALDAGCASEKPWDPPEKRWGLTCQN